MPVAVWGQQYDYNWVIGTVDYGDRDTSGRFGGILFTFHDSFEVTARAEEVSLLEFGEEGTTMSTRDGMLALYTNGCEVHGANGQLLEDGDTLNPGTFVVSEFCYPDDPWLDQTSAPGPHGVLALPHPVLEDHYYVIVTVGAEDPFDRVEFALHGWEVAIDRSAGSGRVVRKEVLVDNARLDESTLSATKQTKAGHWWQICRDFATGHDQFNLIDFYTLDSFSVHRQRIGPNTEVDGRGLFSSDGTQYLTTAFDDRMTLYQFDSTTGLLSDPHTMDYPPTPNALKTGYFAPGGRYFYAWDSRHMYQLDLERFGEPGALTLIDTYDGFTDPFPTGFGFGQLGPDCRLYICTSSGSQRYHVIDYPDRAGRACSFRQHAIQLPRINNVGIPHYPNYRLDDEPPCDSHLYVSIQPIAPVRETVPTWTLSPVPAYEVVRVELADDRHLTEWYAVYDSSGRLVERTAWPDWQMGHDIAVSDYGAGLYYVQLIDEDGFGSMTMKMAVGRCCI